MTTLQTSPQRERYEQQGFSQDSDRPAKQSQQQADDQDRQGDRDQSGEQTFTVSLDDWFKS